MNQAHEGGPIRLSEDERRLAGLPEELDFGQISEWADRLTNTAELERLRGEAFRGSPNMAERGQAIDALNHADRVARLGRDLLRRGGYAIAEEAEEFLRKTIA